MSEMENFKRYCNQLEKYGRTESVHSPVMAMLRRKARKQLTQLMNDEENDCSSSISKLWIVGYYHPYQFYIREDGNGMETVTLLTMFCGELQEMLSLSGEKYAALWNLYIGDLHRYMPDKEVQNSLSAGYYSRAIDLDDRQGRAFHMLSVVRTGLTFAQKLRLMLLGQLAEFSYKKSSDMMEAIKLEKDNSNTDSSDIFLIDFTEWSLKEFPKRADHQLFGIQLIQKLKAEIDHLPSADWAIILTTCRVVSMLTHKNLGFQQFVDCFDVISSLYLEIYSSSIITKSLLYEAVSWIIDAGTVFGYDDPVKNAPYLLSLSVFAKTKWNELNDLVMEHLNSVFTPLGLSSCSTQTQSRSLLINGPTSEPSLEVLSQLVESLLSITHPTMELVKNRNDDDPVLRRINQSESKRLGIPLEALAEKVAHMNREDWRPVYVLMDFDTILNETPVARKIWDIDDFICILPSSVLDKLDNQKGKIKAVRPVIRYLMELQAEGRITLKQCDDERHCAEQLVQSVKGSSDDHKHIVAFLCQSPGDEEPMEGVTFYDIKQFYTKYLE